MKLVFQWTSGAKPQSLIQLGQTQFNKMVLSEFLRVRENGTEIKILSCHLDKIISVSSTRKVHIRNSLSALNFI